MNDPNQETDELRSGERRAAMQEVAKETESVRKTNYGLIVAVIFLAAVLVTLATLMWDINERAKERDAVAQQRQREESINEYLNCVQLFASGVEEKSCAKYRDWINRHTNIRGL